MHGNIDSRKFYATANVTIPEILRGKKGKFHRYQHPDDRRFQVMMKQYFAEKGYIVSDICGGK
jgi:hypothetical protein